MSVIQTIFGVIILISSLVMIATVLLQSGQARGLGAIGGGAETFFGKNKAKSIDGKLALITKICAGVFVVCSLLMLVIH